MGYFKVSDDFIDIHAKELSLKAQMVYICLCRHTDKTGFFSIGRRGISKELGINEKTAKQGIQELVKGGYITPFSWREVGYSGHRGGGRVTPMEGVYNPPKEYRNTYKEEKKINKCKKCKDKHYIENKKTGNMSRCVLCLKEKKEL